jgi:erythromycin esterase
MKLGLHKAIHVRRKIHSMHKTSLLLITLCLTLIATAQVDIKSYIKQNTIAISTIQPDSTDFSDLESIGNAIGESKIVMLGEQDHGDAPAFLAKTRLINYLHEKKGFNVLAFESDFFALNYGWDNLNKNGNDIDTFLRKNIFPIWTSCDACQDLFYNVIPKSYKTEKPIIVTGFDNQMYLKYSNKALSTKFDSVLRQLNLPITRNSNYVSYILPLIDTMTQLSFLRKDNSYYDRLLEQLKTIKQEIAPKIDSNNFWSLIIDNFVQTTIQMRFHKTDYYKSYNARDIQMAKNLKWLSTIKFPNEKIIVWAHNYHISKYGGNYLDNFLNLANTMGTEFTKDTLLNKKTYVIGFTSNSGTAGRITSKPFSVPNPTSKSIENWFDKNLAYAFIDFKKFNTQNPDNLVEFTMKGSIKGVHRNHKAQWTHIFDGVFYIKNMYPCKILD